MTQLRELENSHHEKVTEIGLQYLERFIKGTLDEDPPDDLRKVGWRVEGGGWRVEGGGWRVESGGWVHIL